MMIFGLDNANDDTTVPFARPAHPGVDGTTLSISIPASAPTATS